MKCIGRMNKKIEVLKPIKKFNDTKDSNSSIIFDNIENIDNSVSISTDYELLATIFSSVELVTARYKKYNDIVESDTITHKFTIRYISGIDSSMMILFDNRYFKIHTILNLKEDKKFLEILAEERGVSSDDRSKI